MTRCPRCAVPVQPGARIRLPDLPADPLAPKLVRPRVDFLLAGLSHYISPPWSRARHPSSDVDMDGTCQISRETGLAHSSPHQAIGSCDAKLSDPGGSLNKNGQVARLSRDAGLSGSRKDLRRTESRLDVAFGVRLSLAAIKKKVRPAARNSINWRSSSAVQGLLLCGGIQVPRSSENTRGKQLGVGASRNAVDRMPD